MEKAVVALCVLYAMACCCAIAATAIYSGAVNALFVTGLAFMIPAFGVASYIIEGDQ